MIGHISFKLSVVADHVSPVATTSHACRYRRAFVSYASADRVEVLRRVQGIRATGVDTFQDILDLEPGQRWEKQLYLKITEADVFYLFWSTAAKRSKWVEKEWQYTLDLGRGDEFIRP